MSTLLSLRAGLPVEQPLRGGGDLHGRVLVYRRGLRWQILIELVALHLALLETHRQVQAETAQSAEAVQLVLLAGQTVADLDVPQVDRRWLLMRGLARRCTTHQLLVVHAVVLRQLIALRIQMLNLAIRWVYKLISCFRHGALMISSKASSSHRAFQQLDGNDRDYFIDLFANEFENELYTKARN